MKKRYIVLILTAVLLFGAIRWLGIGYYVSGSAVQDLKEALTAIHGEPYTSREVETGTESMEFFVRPDTFFLTDYNLRNLLGWDYRYQCEVIYTVYQDEKAASVRTVTYTGIDPMGPGKETQRAYLEHE